MTDENRLSFDEESLRDSTRKMTAPEELTFARDYEHVYYKAPIDSLERMLRLVSNDIIAHEIRLQRLTLQQSVLRRLVAERRTPNTGE